MLGLGILYSLDGPTLPGQYPGKSNKLGHRLMEALKLVLLIGLVFMAFGPSYSYSLIRLLYGEKWSDGEASAALQFYCIYVIVLAMNGTSEAFLHAVATESELKHSNDSLLWFSGIYLVLNVLLLKFAGAVGLIMANSLNMILRTVYSSMFIKRYFQLLAFRMDYSVVSGIITLLSENIFLDRRNFLPTLAIHFSVGLACFCMSSYVIYRREKPFINRIIRFRDHSD